MTKQYENDTQSRQAGADLRAALIDAMAIALEQSDVACPTYLAGVAFEAMAGEVSRLLSLREGTGEETNHTLLEHLSEALSLESRG